jgi:formate/nitrite transporter FocA (FNT family)
VPELLPIKGVDEAKHEQLTVLERKELTAQQVHAALRTEGEEELGRGSQPLFWSAVSCGLTLGLSLTAQGVLQHALPDAPWRPLLASLGYSLGFIVLILARQELYTSNTLTAVLPVLDSWRAEMIPNLLRVSIVVLAGNLLGAVVFAWAAVSTSAFSPSLRETFASIGVHHAGYGVWPTLVKGIYGGWMIALMTWVMPGAHHARIWVIALVTWCLSAAEMTHVIAGSVDVLCAVFSGQVAASAYIGEFLIPTFVGNTLGGMVLVAVLNHAQVVAGSSTKSSKTSVPRSNLGFKAGRQ